jgi:hypothetical protein
MANLKRSEKTKLENYLDMRTGYVCDFTNSTFEEFVQEHTGVEIYADKYSGSKANRLRAFWDEEPNHLVAKLLGEMIEYWRVQKAIPLSGYQMFNPALHEECKKIVQRLRSEAPIENIDVLTPKSNDKDFHLLGQSIRESIEKNQPEQGLDRLHTFLIKYMRELCTRHGLSFDNDTPLHSLFGVYVKFLQNKKLIESEMTERILKSSISVLDSFNSVRNNQSLAHANPVLNYNESVLIFNDITNIVGFVDAIEPGIAEKKKQEKLQTKVVWKGFEYSVEGADDAWVQQLLDISRDK